MRIVELGDCSMAIMKDSEDSYYMSIGAIYRRASAYNMSIIVDKGDWPTINYLETKDYIYSAGRLILFFKETIDSRFHLHDKVYVSNAWIY